MSSTLAPALALLASAASAQELPAGPGQELVVAHCTACHSHRLIIQNRGTEEDWRRLIRWMQETQNLWPIPADQLDSIVGYLSTHYAPDRALRRKPLPAWQLPPKG